MIPYIGGKSYLASWIISHFPENYTEKTYVEAFGGGGWVLFKKDRSYVEVYNDLNSKLVNLFRVIRDNYKEFEHRAQWSLHSREMYNEAREKLKDDKFLSEIENAMYAAVEQVQSFSGRGGWGYVINVSKMTNGKWLPFLRRLEAINARLKHVQIECLDFEKIITKYDGKNTLFYLDPPYVNVEHYYDTDTNKFRLNDHKRLAQLLRNIEGKFVLSYYENDMIREFYKGNNFAVKTTSKHSYGMTKSSKRKEKPKATELLIMNY